MKDNVGFARSMLNGGIRTYRWTMQRVTQYPDGMRGRVKEISQNPVSGTAKVGVTLVGVIGASFIPIPGAGFLVAENYIIGGITGRRLYSFGKSLRLGNTEFNWREEIPPNPESEREYKKYLNSLIYLNR